MSSTELNGHVIARRSADQVMRPEWMGAVRHTRYSFSRMLTRRAFTDGWHIAAESIDLDDQGRGEVVYRIEIGSRVFYFVAFTTTIDETAHTDRVVADRWEITATLSEGPLTDDLLDHLRQQVPLQERGRLDHRVLVLTRGNRSVRFFQYLVDTLAAGQQPDPDQVADAGYIMRSTAFYGNGKFGMRSFEGYEPGHPLGAPYRAQMLCAWLFRELGYVVVEHCARAKGGGNAVGFDPAWSRFFGLGNATGLGLVPYAFKHPAIIDAWVRIREDALAQVRAEPGTAGQRALLRWWIDRVAAHFSTGTDDDCRPFLNGASLGPIADRVARQFEVSQHEPRPFDHLYRWAEEQGPEVAELVVSLLIELHEGDDHAVDDALVVDESKIIDPATTVAEVRSRLDRYQWLNALDLDGERADWFWWLVSDNTDEPRRAPRPLLAPEGRDVAVDVALRLRDLARSLAAWPDDTPIQRVLGAEPQHHLAVARLGHDCTYGEPHDNACHRDYLPLMVQRFQLATYGMDNFKPKSTDWLRVTLLQGAPRIGDLAGAVDEVIVDRWVWPPRPDRARPEASNNEDTGGRAC